MAEMPNFLQDQTEEQIMQRMLDRVPSDIDKSEGSFIWDAEAPVAYMLSEAAVWAQQVLQRGFASSTFGEYLDLRTAEHGVVRRPAVAATGEVTFKGTVGKAVPKGTVVATPADEFTGESSIEFETLTAVTLKDTGEASVAIRALVPGKAGTVPTGVINIISTPISGVSSVSNDKETRGGGDVESDEALLERYYSQVRNQGTSGNKAQYIKWAGEVAGVGGVQVAPLWQGPGTVGVYLLDGDKRAANGDIVQAAQIYIDPTIDGQGEGKAPAGPIVTVMAADELAINLSVQLTLAAGVTLEQVKSQITSGVTAYLKQLAFADPLVRITRIAAVMLDIPSIIDYSDLTINGLSDSNIQVRFGQVAVLGTVDAHE